MSRASLQSKSRLSLRTSGDEQTTGQVPAVMSFTQELFSLQSALIGGFSILFFIGTWFFVDKSNSLYSISIFMASMAFVMNHPHFLSSYILLYSDYREKIFKQPRFFWAAVVVPVLLAGSLAYALISQSVPAMATMVNVMYFSVGWHYVKQIFGCVIVSSVRQKKYFSTWERRSLLAHLYCIWGLSWFSSQIGNNNFEFYGIHYSSFGLPAISLNVVYGLAFASLLWTLYLQGKKYIREGVIPSATAVVAVFSLYVWYLPFAAHPAYAYSIPFFHSLQYLTLVSLLKKNETAALAADMPKEDGRAFWLQHFWGFLAMAVLTGSLAFEFMPKSLDRWFGSDFAALSVQAFLASFLLFINIHHYFIDNVIWRSDNESLRKYLFSKPLTAQG